MKNTSRMAEFRYRPIKMLSFHHSTSTIKRGQHRIPHLTTISSRGHYQYPRRTLTVKLYIYIFRKETCHYYHRTQREIPKKTKVRQSAVNVPSYFYVYVLQLSQNISYFYIAIVNKVTF